MAGDKKEERCAHCGISSDRRPLVSYLFKGEQRWVCVRCLPMLIHGGGQG